MAEVTRLWGGRFRSGPDPALTTLSRSSPSYFATMAPYDLAGSRAHARELHRSGILGAGDLDRVLAAIDEVDAGTRAGAIEPSGHDEDVHTFLERVLIERLGPLGGRLRAGRSRNDQAANDLRLYLRDHTRTLVELVLELQAALFGQAERHLGTVAPGFTHLQPAQPVSLGHQLLAHAQAFARDISRLQDWDRRSARSPLGAAALAGSAFALSPEHAAEELGYDAPFENSIDAVAARDHVAEFLFATAMLATDLSRLAEEITLWASRQFGWVTLDDGFSTGSSIMPQKKNPDVAELTRGKAGRLIGNLTAVLAVLKSLPLAYNRDLAEDKAAALDTVDTLFDVLPAMSGLVATLRFHPDVLRAQSTDGFTLATEVADWLARAGVPFHEAHEITGNLVTYCEDAGRELGELSADELSRVDARLTADVLPRLTPEAALESRRGHGGTAPERVGEQLAALRRRSEGQRAWAGDYAGPRS
jgi:argininosuccinate lyase